MDLSVEDVRHEIRLNQANLKEQLACYFSNRAEEVINEEISEPLKHVDQIFKEYLSLKQVNMSLLKNTDVERMFKIDIADEQIDESDIEDIKLDMDFIDADRIKRVQDELFLKLSVSK